MLINTRKWLLKQCFMYTQYVYTYLRVHALLSCRYLNTWLSGTYSRGTGPHTLGNRNCFVRNLPCVQGLLSTQFCTHSKNQNHHTYTRIKPSDDSSLEAQRLNERIVILVSIQWELQVLEIVLSTLHCIVSANLHGSPFSVPWFPAGRLRLWRSLDAPGVYMFIKVWMPCGIAYRSVYNW